MIPHPAELPGRVDLVGDEFLAALLQLVHPLVHLLHSEVIHFLDEVVVFRPAGHGGGVRVPVAVTVTVTVTGAARDGPSSHRRCGVHSRPTVDWRPEPGGTVRGPPPPPGPRIGAGACAQWTTDYTAASVALPNAENPAKLSAFILGL